MRRFSLVEFSVEHPRLIVLLTIIITLAFATQFTKITTDTNPTHMLPETSDVRVWNDEVEKTFSLYEDMIVVGIVNEKGILNKKLDSCLPELLFLCNTLLGRQPSRRQQDRWVSYRIKIYSADRQGQLPLLLSAL